MYLAYLPRLERNSDSKTSPLLSELLFQVLIEQRPLDLWEQSPMTLASWAPLERALPLDEFRHEVEVDRDGDVLLDLPRR